MMDEQMPQETHEDGEEVKAVEANGNREVKEKAEEKATNGHEAAEEEKSGSDGAGAVKKVENGVKKVATSAVGGVKRILESKAFGGECHVFRFHRSCRGTAGAPRILGVV